MCKISASRFTADKFSRLITDDGVESEEENIFGEEAEFDPADVNDSDSKCLEEVLRRSTNSH